MEKSSLYLNPTRSKFTFIQPNPSTSIPLTKVLESTIHTIIKPHLTQCLHQYGFNSKYSTTSAIHSIISGFNQKRPPHRIALIAIDFKQALDNINIINLMNKIINTTTMLNILKRINRNKYTRKTRLHQLQQPKFKDPYV